MIQHLVASILKPAADGLFDLAMAVPLSVVRLIFLGVFFGAFGAAVVLGRLNRYW